VYSISVDIFYSTKLKLLKQKYVKYLKPLNNDNRR
jgi:hypothetical protein